MAEMKLRIKLVIEGKRVLFAEAGKDFVDFLFSILTLPVSTIIGVVGKQEMVGSLPNLYQSIETLHYSFFRPDINKSHALLSPVPPLSGYSVPIFSLKEPPTPAPVKIFHTCECLCHYPKEPTNPKCSNCKGTTKSTFGYAAESRRCEGGFVKELVTYMVMDDLGVEPMSSISSITNLLNQFNIKNVCTLEEKVVDIGKNEALKLLKASFVTKTVLTNVFLDDANKEST